MRERYKKMHCSWVLGSPLYGRTDYCYVIKGIFVYCLIILDFNAFLLSLPHLADIYSNLAAANSLHSISLICLRHCGGLKHKTTMDPQLALALESILRNFQDFISLRAHHRGLCSCWQDVCSRSNICSFQLSWTVLEKRQSSSKAKSHVYVSP